MRCAMLISSCGQSEEGGRSYHDLFWEIESNLIYKLISPFQLMCFSNIIIECK